VLWFVLLVEWFWLLPKLDERVSLYLSGSTPNASYHHILFIALEILKVGLLLICSTAGLIQSRPAAGRQNSATMLARMKQRGMD
jgi:hypothetical protein